MSGADTEDLLEKLLRDAATSSTPRAVQEAAADGGHPDDEQLRALEAGELSGDLARTLRRHVLFCDDCAARSVQAGGEPDVVAPAPTPTHSGASPLPDRTVRRYRLVFIAVLVAVAVASGFLVMESTKPVDDDPDETSRVIEPGLDVRSIGSDGEGEPGLVHIDEAVVLLLRDQRGEQPQQLYAMMVDKTGRVYPLRKERITRKVQGLVRLDASGQGFDVGALTEIKIGDQLAFLVLVSSEPIPALEGEIRDQVTMKRLSESFAPIFPLADDDPKALLAEFRRFGFGGVVRAQVVRVRL